MDHRFSDSIHLRIDSCCSCIIRSVLHLLAVLMRKILKQSIIMPQNSLINPAVIREEQLGQGPLTLYPTMTSRPPRGIDYNLENMVMEMRRSRSGQTCSSADLSVVPSLAHQRSPKNLFLGRPVQRRRVLSLYIDKVAIVDVMISFVLDDVTIGYHQQSPEGQK